MKNFENLVSFCKRRGFVYPSSEIYGGFGAVYDYGPYGTELKNNIADAWWKYVVRKHVDVVGIDSGIFMHPMTWKASGHVDSFDDPQIDCKECNNRIRADHLLEEQGIEADKMTSQEINAEIEKLKAKGIELKCPKCGSTDLTPAKRFSLMVKSNLGSPTEELSEDNVVYARAETCQGIYLNYKNVIDSVRVKPPFGIAQIGKAFRNEIVARQFVFRTREFEQMEMQYFCHPDDASAIYDQWREERWNWYLEYGIAPENIRWHQHTKLAHYASQAFDIEYNYEILGGFKEIEGFHMRGDWDLSQHMKFSGQNLEYTDPKRDNEKYIPNVVETSVGLNRLLLAFLSEAYTEEKLEDGTERTVLKLDPRLAPVKVAVFPLLKNKEHIVEKAKEIFAQLADKFSVEYDDNSNIGKRYRRQDEIGTPYCVTIDFGTMGEETPEQTDTVTIRNRDTLEQVRVKIDELENWLTTNLKS